MGTAQLYRVCRGEAAAWRNGSPGSPGRWAWTWGSCLDSTLDVRPHATYIQTMTTAETTEKLYTIRMRSDERARVDALAAHYSIPVAAVIRMLVKRDADALGIIVTPKPSKRGRK